MVLEDGKWSGQEALIFFIAAPDTLRDQDNRELHERYTGPHACKGGGSLEGNVAFYNCSKSKKKKLFGWKHKAVPDETN